MIDGVMVKQLKVVPDDRGRLMECLRNDDELGEVRPAAAAPRGRPGGPSPRRRPL